VNAQRATPYQAPYEEPPAYIIHEQAALACPLIDQATLDEMSGLQAGDFILEMHAVIWRAITIQRAAGVPLSMATVSAKCGELLGSGHELLPTICTYLPQLVRLQQVPIGAAHHAERVRSYALVRRLQVKAEALLALCQADDLRAIEDAQALGQFAAGGAGGGAQTRTLSDVVASTMERIEARSQPDMTPRLPTGIAALAEMNTFGPGHFVILSARTNVGKTLLAYQMALHMTGRGHPGLFVSMEMDGEELTERALSSESGIAPRFLAAPQDLGDRWPALAAGANRLSLDDRESGPRPLDILDAGALGLEDILSAARRLKAQTGLSFLAIDYIQLLPMPDPSRVNVAVALNAITKRLKRVARELQITVLALSQINRDGDGGRPDLRNLKGGGSQEEDADAVLLMWPNGDRGEEGWVNGVQHLVLDVRKNRHGPKRAINLLFQPDTLTIQEVG